MVVGLTFSSCSKVEEELAGTIDLTFGTNTTKDVDVAIVFAETETNFATGTQGSFDYDSNYPIYLLAITVSQKFNVGDKLTDISLFSVELIPNYGLDAPKTYGLKSGTIERTASDKIVISAAELVNNLDANDVVTFSATLTASAVK